MEVFEHVLSTRQLCYLWFLSLLIVSFAHHWFCMHLLFLLLVLLVVLICVAHLYSTSVALHVFLVLIICSYSNIACFTCDYLVFGFCGHVSPKPWSRVAFQSLERFCRDSLARFSREALERHSGETLMKSFQRFCTNTLKRCSAGVSEDISLDKAPSRDSILCIKH